MRHAWVCALPYLVPRLRAADIDFGEGSSDAARLGVRTVPCLVPCLSTSASILLHSPLTRPRVPLAGVMARCPLMSVPRSVRCFMYGRCVSSWHSHNTPCACRICPVWRRPPAVVQVAAWSTRAAPLRCSHVLAHGCRLRVCLCLCLCIEPPVVPSKGDPDLSIRGLCVFCAVWGVSCVCSSSGFLLPPAGSPCSPSSAACVSGPAVFSCFS